MSKLLCAVMCLGLALGSMPAHAQDTPPPSAQPAAARPEDGAARMRKFFLNRPNGQPSRLERLIVAGVASVLAVASLGVGVGAGIWALMDYQCLKDVHACNRMRPANDQITGTNFLRRRADGERKAIVADMGYLAAATAAAVAILGVASAFWPAGWWPFASDEQPADVPPRQVVTELAPAAPEPPPAAPAATEPAPAPEAAPAPAEAPAPPPPEPTTTTGTPETGSTTP